MGVARSIALVVAALALVLVAATALPPARLALGAGCVGGLALLHAHRRRALTAVMP